jgi:hypothetical protein
VFISELNIQHLECAYSGVPYTIDTKIIRRRVAAIGKTSIRPNGISTEIPKLVGKAMIPYLARLLDITMSNGTLPADGKRAIVVPVHEGCDRSLVTNCRPVILTSVVCKQMEHVIAFKESMG